MGRALSVRLDRNRASAAQGLAGAPEKMEAIMPAKSKAQQKAAGAALSAKRGDTKKSELKGPSRGMYDSMSETQLEELAETRRKGKPDHVSDG